jgi:hypothetical protein
MKTLVIHPNNPTTDFLKKIYEGKDYTVFDCYNYTNDDLINVIISHDRIIMCGHGSSDGLFDINNGGFIIDNSIVPYLQTKECICIWCNADVFVEDYGLTGLYTGMFISEVEEAYLFQINESMNDIDFSNNVFSGLLGTIIDKYELSEVFDILKKCYYDKENDVMIFNNERIFYEAGQLPV